MNETKTRPAPWRTEDWWSCYIGWAILLLAIYQVLPAGPKIGKEWTELSQILPAGAGATCLAALKVFGVILAGTVLAGAFLKFDLKKLIPGFIAIFLLSFVAIVLSNQSQVNFYGIEYVLFALIFGLIISNVFRTPPFLKAAGLTEFYVKVGLVCYGAEIMFTSILAGGIYGLIQAFLVATTVWFLTYWICRRFGVEERFSAIIASANSICGVSATIAAGGAIQGKPKEISYMVAWVMVCAVVLILVMPPIAGLLGLSPEWAGAWMGGVIDNTGAVIAAGETLRFDDPTQGDAALKAANLVKMAQNVLIGLAAFLIALWGTISLDRKENPDLKKPSFMEVWYRFPKFVIGFVVASIVVTYVVQGIWDEPFAKAVGNACKGYRNWFFALCFVSIGLETNFKELVSVGGGRPAIAYWISQFANALWTLLVAWVLWSGDIFPVPALK